MLGTGSDPPCRANRAPMTTRTAAAAMYAIRCRRSGSNTSAKLGAPAKQPGYKRNSRPRNCDNPVVRVRRVAQSKPANRSVCWAFSMVCSAHGEAGQAFGVLVEDLDLFDLGVPRPAPHEGEQLLDSFFFALEHCFYRSVGAVLHPARDTRRLRFLA